MISLTKTASLRRPTGRDVCRPSAVAGPFDTALARACCAAADITPCTSSPGNMLSASMPFANRIS